MCLFSHLSACCMLLCQSYLTLCGWYYVPLLFSQHVVLCTYYVTLLCLPCVYLCSITCALTLVGSLELFMLQAFACVNQLTQGHIYMLGHNYGLLLKNLLCYILWVFLSGCNCSPGLLMLVFAYFLSCSDSLCVRVRPRFRLYTLTCLCVCIICYASGMVTYFACRSWLSFALVLLYTIRC